MSDVTKRSLCRHCKSFDDEHVDGKCLFDSTSFEPMNEQEVSEFVKGYLNGRLEPYWGKSKPFYLRKDTNADDAKKPTN